MKLFGASLVLAAVLALSRAGPINSTLTRQSRGLCDYKRQHCLSLFGAFCPRCDPYGNFLPQQCSGSNGYCWCVDVITGEEIPNTRTRPGVMPVNCEMDTHCPSGWSRFGYRCFIFIDAPKLWAEAEFYCQFDQANLASVHSDEENYFLQSLTRGDTHYFPETWIGGTDAIHLGLWMWSDGSKFDYENDHDHHHDHDHDEETERCLMMNYHYDLKWTTALCNDTRPFVCSKSG